MNTTHNKDLFFTKFLIPKDKIAKYSILLNILDKECFSNFSYDFYYLVPYMLIDNIGTIILTNDAAAFSQNKGMYVTFNMLARYCLRILPNRNPEKGDEVLIFNTMTQEWDIDIYSRKHKNGAHNTVRHNSILICKPLY